MSILAHLADVHIGAGRSWWNDLQSESPRYLERHRAMLWEILGRVKELKIQKVLITGDLFDHPRPTQKEHELAAEWLHELADLVTVHIIPGNHEVLFNHVTAFNSISAYLRKHNSIQIHTKLEVAEDADGIWLWAPYTYTNEIERHLQEHKKVDFVVAHYAAKGCVYANGMTAAKGWELNYRPGQIKQWFLGDIHARQKVAPNAWYSGSPCQLNFGESGSKGFDVYDTFSGERQSVLLSKAAPLQTVIVKDFIPEFNPGVIYRVFATRDYYSSSYPENVVSLKLLESSKSEIEINNDLVASEIDFGDPLVGLTDALNRAGLPERLYGQAEEIARSWIKS
jgi:DNA repair exonuclease SbcCD nuclease subunit